MIKVVVNLIKYNTQVQVLAKINLYITQGCFSYIHEPLVTFSMKEKETTLMEKLLKFA